MIPGSANPLLLASAAAAGGYQVQRSLRFSSSDSAFCSRTPAVAGNRQTWTWAGWVKRAALGSTQMLFGTTGTTDATYSEIFFTSADKLEVALGYTSVARIRTTQVFRDPSAWQHIVVAYDNTQATASNRLRLYVNGSEVTAFDTDTRSTFSNTDLGINSTQTHYIGIGPNSGSNYLSAYLTELHLIDGQQLTPSSFTEVSATTGQLIPKAYSGTYGTNGFYLKFADNSTTAALGTDTSGTDLGNAITTPASNAPPTVDYLIVGGGGGAGGDLSGGGGGGGVLASSVSLTSSTSYAVAVGAGGAGNTGNTAGLNGGNSSFNAIIALGGGGGAGDTAVATTGGSGGGASTGGGNSAARTGAAGTSPQGYAGGNGFAYPGGPGGGGGAGQAGSNGGSANGTGGNGGNGVQSSITGTATYYGGGGGGGGDSRLSGPAGTGGLGGGGNGAFGGNGSNGTANTGGGGGGGSQFGGDGGNGGSGVVIIRYANTYADLSIGSGLTYSLANSGGYKIYTFTASTAANNWTVNNFSVTAGSDNDSLVDTPTSYGTDTGAGGEVRGNYATLNPLWCNSNITLSNGNLDLSSTTLAWKSVSSTIAIPTSGKWYFEVLQTVATSYLNVGVVPVGFTLSNHPGSTSTSWSWQSSAAKWNSSQTSWGSATTNGDIIMIAVDRDSGKIWAGANGTWFSSGNPASGTNEMFSGLGSDVLVPAIGVYDITSCVMNFGQRAFSYTAPTNFKALCDTNLGAPVVAKPNTLMDVALWTGNGSTQTISGLGFSPDLVWLKGRSLTSNHRLYDQIRGATKSIYSDLTDPEGTESTGLTAFTSDGFSLGDQAGHNQNASTYVGWAWDAGTSTVSNTAGSITSQVRANVSAGFSVVTYTGDLSSSGTSTVGHGLGVAPKMIIFKRRDGTSSWPVQHSGLPSANNLLYLNETAATSTSAYGTIVAPTSTVFTVAWITGMGVSGQTHVAYCFAPVVGYSSFGSYTGNGSADGPFVFCNFRPRYLMIKRSSGIGAWAIYDSVRLTYNASNVQLYANSSGAEVVDDPIDILSNGFKIRGTGSAFNGSGETYVFAAFAESPFQYARAR
jgi:hypothetical protein